MPPPYPPKPYRIRSPETWDLVRTAYLRGESARSLAERFGVTVSNIRRRAGEEGWTKRGHAEAMSEPSGRRAAPEDDLSGDPRTAAEAATRAAARAISQGRLAEAQGYARLAETMRQLSSGSGLPPAPAGGEGEAGSTDLATAGPVDEAPGAEEAAESVRPEDAARQALAHASRAAAAGRAGEAQALIKSAEALVRISEAHPELVAAPADENLCPRCRERDDPMYDNAYEGLWAFAEQLAEALIADPPFANYPFGRAARRWRAEHLGPEIAEADRQQAIERRHYGHFYNKDGSIRGGLGTDPFVNTGWTLEKQREVDAGKRPPWPDDKDF